MVTSTGPSIRSRIDWEQTRVEQAINTELGDRCDWALLSLMPGPADSNRIGGRQIWQPSGRHRDFGRFVLAEN